MKYWMVICFIALGACSVEKRSREVSENQRALREVPLQKQQERSKKNYAYGGSFNLNGAEVRALAEDLHGKSIEAVFETGIGCDIWVKNSDYGEWINYLDINPNIKRMRVRSEPPVPISELPDPTKVR